MKRSSYALVLVALLAFLLAPALALAGPRSGSSFGGRVGFRPKAGSYSRNYSQGRPAYNRGPSFVFLPGFGWGWGPFGGASLVGTMFMLAVVGVGAALVVRAVRRSQLRHAGVGDHEDDEDQVQTLPGRAFVTKLQLGLGRSARAIQERLDRFAAEGDTATEAGLARLLHQTSLELIREKDSIRYGAVETSGPMSLTNGETKLNSMALGERARFSVERVRGADGKVRRAAEAPQEAAEVLEYLVVTLVVATRTALPGTGKVTDRAELEAALHALGTVSPEALLGVEVVWTPADPQDALTKSDLILSYPELRSV